MSTTPSKKKPAKKATVAEMSPKLPAWLNRNLVVVLSLIVLAGIPFALGKYFEFSIADAFDGGAYAYSARHILSGARIGHEEQPSAQAGTLLVNILGQELSGFNETGAEVLQMLIQLAALTLMFLTVRRLSGTLAAVISVIVASVYLSAPLIAKYGNVKEQFMIAFMIMGICGFIFYQLTGRWWWAVLAGSSLVCGPMFKQTGLSAIAAVGLFLMAQPLLHHYAWKKVGKDILLLAAGAILVLTPIIAWYVRMDSPTTCWPYSFLFRPVLSVFHAGGQATELSPAQTPAAGKTDDSLILKLLPGYVSESWKALDSAGRKEAFLRVLRYYKLLLLPIGLALGAILARTVVLLRGRRGKPEDPTGTDPGRFVPLLALWWVFDMAFTWVSPRSYEQYYLPLNASAAMLGSYLVGLYAHRLRTDRDRTRWVILGLLGAVLMIAMSWHIFFGILKSPHSGAPYLDRTRQPIRGRGYLQKWQEVRQGAVYSWESVGDYIRQHSEPADPIYVWGWVPGIYVRAQRMSAVAKAFEGLMQTVTPEELSKRVQELLQAFQDNPPKYIVDTRKEDFPWNRPPLELWPITAVGEKNVACLPPDPAMVSSYDAFWVPLLRQYFGGQAEAGRYQAMAPLRKYVMENYTVADPRGYRAAQTRFGLPTLVHETFGIFTVFVRKPAAGGPGK